jgi:hypothetical protein
MIRGDPVLLTSVNALREVVTSCDVFPDLVAAKDRIDALLRQVEAGLAASSRPFRIVLTGGTGVGKSTLLNALAKAEIAPVGETRPTTKGFTTYLHEEDQDHWAEGCKLTSIVRHRRDELRGKAIIDSPDADSSHRANRGLLEEMIAGSDLVVLVATQEKYVSASLLRLVRNYRRGRAFAFVFNKTDLCASRSVLNDYTRVLAELGLHTSRIFAISAKRATAELDHEDEMSDREFRALEDFIARELDHARIKAIENMNIGERVTDVRLLVESVLPVGWESAAGKWREHCHELTSQLFAEIGTTVRSSILERNELVDTITMSRGSRLAGPFGLFSEVMYALHRFRAPAVSLARSVDTENWVRTRAGAMLSETIRRREQLVREGCCHDGIEFGLDPGALREAVRCHADDGAAATEWFAQQLASDLRKELEHSSRPPGAWVSIIVNTVPWAWMLYWAYRLVEPAIAGETVPWEAVPGAALVLLGFVFLQWSLVHRSLKWNARKRADALISRVLSSLETAFIGRQIPPIVRAVSRIETCTHKLKGSLQALTTVTPSVSNEVVQHETSPLLSSSDGATAVTFFSGHDGGSASQ